MLVVSSIVEGHGEIQAVPALLYRIAEYHGVHASELRVPYPIRVKAGSLLHDMAYFTRHIQLAAEEAVVATRRLGDAWGCVLIMLDCEDGCPATLGVELLDRARSIRNDTDYLVVLAYREYESWFIAAARSLRGVCGLPDDLEPPMNVELIRGAKGWLNQRMPIKYDEITHQLVFTRHFSIDEACAIPSFARLCSRLGTRLGVGEPVTYESY